LEHLILSKFPTYQKEENKWLAFAAIESFFSWTEHVFILIHILRSKAYTANQVNKLINANKWGELYKLVLPVKDNNDNNYYFSKLTIIREQIRNFVAHGAFGKSGQAFKFHCNAGAIPMTLVEEKEPYSFSFNIALEFENHEAIILIENFINHLWDDNERNRASMYIHEQSHPLILTMAKDGTYKKAMKSDNAMNKLIEKLNYLTDEARNMDF
jgi:hypothetical protein